MVVSIWHTPRTPEAYREDTTLEVQRRLYLPSNCPYHHYTVDRPFWADAPPRTQPYRRAKISCVVECGGWRGVTQASAAGPGSCIIGVTVEPWCTRSKEPRKCLLYLLHFFLNYHFKWRFATRYEFSAWKASDLTPNTTKFEAKLRPLQTLLIFSILLCYVRLHLPL